MEAKESGASTYVHPITKKIMPVGTKQTFFDGGE